MGFLKNLGRLNPAVRLYQSASELTFDIQREKDIKEQWPILKTRAMSLLPEEIRLQAMKDIAEGKEWRPVLDYAQAEFEKYAMAGSIKGDVKKKHFTLCGKMGCLSDIQPPADGCVEASRSGVGRWPSVVGMRSHGCAFSARLIQRLEAAGWLCQPWFYLRLAAYGFVGLSEGAYGGP